VSYSSPQEDKTFLSPAEPSHVSRCSGPLVGGLGKGQQVLEGRDVVPCCTSVCRRG
jgi:hypothetical protein